MKTLLGLLFSLILNSQFFAQKRLVYEYKFIPDITKKDSVITDYMNLDSDMKSSVFYSSYKNVSDSLRREMLKTNTKINLPYYNPNLIYTITKNYSANTTVYHIQDSGIKFKITEKKPIKWTIMTETAVIHNYKCQKATVELYGRKWVAWFTEEIPLQDGPYKFGNLPGLIIKIEDMEKNHVFELIEIKNLKNFALSTKSDHEKEITIKQLNDLLDNRAKNIVSNISEMFVQPNSIGFTMKDGNVIQLDKSTKNIDKALEKIVKKTNNPIELSTE